MTIARLIAAFIARRPVTWAFHVVVLASSVAVLVAVVLLRDATDRRLERDLAGIDLVVGAKGSPLQLVMSAVLQVDAPTGNILLDEADRLRRHPLVAMAAPVSLGDSVGAVRIVGTTPDYPALYGAEIDEGRAWAAPMEAVLGAEAARRLALSVGQTFRGQHGLDEADHAHATPYTVVGILNPTGAVIDRVILTDLESVWNLHEEEAKEQSEGASKESRTPHEGEHAAHLENDEPQGDAAREVTAVLIRYRSPLGAVVVPRDIARTPHLIAASPAREATRLTALAGLGAESLTRLGGAFLALSSLGFVIALTGAISARRRDLAVLRALGAPPLRLMLILVAEGAALGALGGVLGLAMGRAGAAWVGMQAQGLDLPIPGFGLLDALVTAVALSLGILAALGPAVLASRADPVPALSGDVSR